MTKDECRAWLRLARSRRIDACETVRLLKAIGWPEELFRTDYAALVKTVGTEMADELRRLGRGAEDDAVDAAIAWEEAHAEARIIPLTDPGYPEALLQSGRAPIVLFVRGSAELLERPKVAFLGAERSDAEGVENAREFARALAVKRLTALLRLERGIPAEAILAAPENAALLLGTGCDRSYPADLVRLQRSVLEAGGLLLSPFFPGTGYSEKTLEVRDRMTAALADAALILRAEATSPLLRIARDAADLGRDVFAVPGSIHSPYSKGPHRLIREGAKLVESVGDILKELRNPS